MPSPYTGKVTEVGSDPNSFKIHVPDPPPEGSDLIYVNVSDSAHRVACAAYIKGSDVTVTGEPPACTKVVAK